MSRVRSPFGRQRRGDPKGRPSPEARPNEGMRSVGHRSTFCDVCLTTVDAMYDDRHFLTAVMLHEPTREDTVNIIESCPGCDIDICSRCARWVRDESDKTLYRPSCKVCGSVLHGKTEVDRRRLREGLENIASINDIRRIRRLIRIAHEESPLFIEGAGQSEYTALLYLLGERESALQ